MHAGPSRPRGGRTRALAGLWLALSLSACDSPSAHVDGGDLLGALDDAAPGDAGAPKPLGPKASAKVSASASAPVAVRAPSGAGRCLEAGPALDPELRRTVGRPGCRDATIFEWKDREGSPRYACLYGARGAEPRAPLPLVVYFHPHDDDPTTLEDRTGLKKLLGKADVSRDPAHRGMLVLAVQGRALRARDGTTFDTARVGDDNADLAAIDHFVAETQKLGLVDPQRVYSLGAGSGGEMAAFLALARPELVAAVGTFAALAPGARWTCPEAPAPLFAVYRACDSMSACERVEKHLETWEGWGGEVERVRLGEADGTEPACRGKQKCGREKGQALHVRWPKGRNDELLRFFSRHALAARK